MKFDRYKAFFKVIVIESHGFRHCLGINFAAYISLNFGITKYIGKFHQFMPIFVLFPWRFFVADVIHSAIILIYKMYSIFILIYFSGITQNRQ